MYSVTLKTLLHLFSVLFKMVFSRMFEAVLRMFLKTVISFSFIEVYAEYRICV